MTEKTVTVCVLDILAVIFISVFIGFVFGGSVSYNSTKYSAYVEGQQSCKVCEVNK